MVGSAKSIYDSRTIFTGLFFFILGVAINSANADCKCFVGQLYGTDTPSGVRASECKLGLSPLCSAATCYSASTTNACTGPGFCSGTVQCGNENCNDVCKKWGKEQGQSDTSISYLDVNHGGLDFPDTPQGENLDHCRKAEQFDGPLGPSPCGVCLCTVTEAHRFELVPCKPKS